MEEGRAVSMKRRGARAVVVKRAGVMFLPSKQYNGQHYAILICLPLDLLVAQIQMQIKGEI